MSLLPARRDDAPRSSRQIIRATQAQERTELAIFQHSLDTRYQVECDRIDSQAIADVVKTALDEELTVLDWGLERANGSQAKAEMVARKVTLMSNANTARIGRRFAG